MKQRIDINDVQPDAFKAMFGVEKYLSGTELDPTLKALIKIRASQMNGCAFCIAMHTQEALKQGESEQRLFALSAWRESPLFSEREESVLRLTEELTLASEGGLSDACYDAALSELGQRGLAGAIMQIAAINAWNRIAVATHMVFEQ